MMESLQLPYWTEVTSSSPQSAYHIDNEEFQLFDNFANDFLTTNDVHDDITTATTTPTTSSSSSPAAAHELLLELDQEIQNEPAWYHNPKLEFIYEQLSPVPQNAETEQLLSEFDDICSAVGVQLTPPTTPPMSPKTSIASSSPVQELPAEYFMGAPIVYMVTDDMVTQEIPSSAVSVIDEASNESMDIIEELVREHTTNLPSNDDIYAEMSDNVSVFSSSNTSSYAPSQCSDDTSSCASFMSPRSTDSYGDDEWTPSVDKKRTLKRAAAASRTKSTEPKREKRPYGRPLHEKKARKKEQNKNAATRYRQKKKEQLAVVLSEEEQLLKITEKLQTEYDDRKRELRTLMNLLKDVGILK
ncbi:activating transcription factor of chaperone-like [Culicoides brevitarsis]|uniref:activating transcription factor of chaperone-like n=1 Tax=Culicoides brevitarsis TaxID=469753 RepID=UPI00307C2FC9